MQNLSKEAFKVIIIIKFNRKILLHSYIIRWTENKFESKFKTNLLKWSQAQIHNKSEENKSMNFKGVMI